MNDAPSEVWWSENNLEIGGRQREERERGKKSIKNSDNNNSDNNAYSSGLW